MFEIQKEIENQIAKAVDKHLSKTAISKIWILAFLPTWGDGEKGKTVQKIANETRLATEKVSQYLQGLKSDGRARMYYQKWWKTKKAI